jgi:glycosyltransferase involved in cell wall biosynthesis
MGIGVVKHTHPRLVAISRAHGYDLYEARHSHQYIPCRTRSLRLIDRVFPDSEAGTRYLADRFPWFASKCETARLGVKEPGFVTSASSDGVVRIVSCSFVVPVKRIDLLLKGIHAAATQRPQQRFEWHHFGNGPLREAIVNQAEAVLPSNVKSCFPGYSTATNLMQFYRENPIDLFANVSESEGTPVSVMEAIGCGLPVIATAVGGNQEIVSERNGQLISPNPTPDEIATAIFEVVDDPIVAARKRVGSRQVWHEQYNAEQNFQRFADRLIEIRQTV